MVIQKNESYLAMSVAAPILPITFLIGSMGLGIKLTLKNSPMVFTIINACRVIYKVNLGEIVYVVHCFQKKSKKGIKTPRGEIEVIKQRLKLLKAIIS